MSAIELIQQVAALPQREKIRFEELFYAMKHGAPVSDPAPHPSWPDFSERLRNIYGDKIASDSQAIIDEGRGDR